MQDNVRNHWIFFAFCLLFRKRQLYETIVFSVFLITMQLHKKSRLVLTPQSGRKGLELKKYSLISILNAT